MLGHLERRAPGPGAGQAIAIGAVIRLGKQPVMHHPHRNHGQKRQHQSADRQKHQVDGSGLVEGRLHLMPLRASDSSTNGMTTHSAAVISKSVRGLRRESPQNATAKTAGAGMMNKKKNIAFKHVYG
jgi:hypothetical protein